MSPLLRVDKLVTGIGAARVVDGVSFDVAAGETYALLGESGCGKSMTALSLMRLLPDGGRILSGRVQLGETDVMALPERDMRRVRGGRMAMVFQEPMLALNPVIKVGDQIGEALSLHQGLGGQAARDAARALLDSVGVPDAARRLDSYPFELSGGLRQRMMIAMALAGEPSLLIADEPTTALDVTIQDQILKLILDLRDELAMSVVFVTHDLGVVAATCDRMAVMYAGRIVESGPVAQVFAQPDHAYTRGLLGSVPRSGTERSPLLSIEGTPPGLMQRPAGCAFHPRCAFATDRCRAEAPRLQPMSPGHEAACFHTDRVTAGSQR